MLRQDDSHNFVRQDQIDDKISKIFEINEGDGAFYGPKIDILMEDSLGRKWQMGTIQLDFQLPLIFDLSYINQNGEKDLPVIIHKTIYESLERFTRLLIENSRGALPL